MGEKIIGQSSGAIYILDKYMLFLKYPVGSVQNIDNYDQNDLFEGEADMILDFTEVNPFEKLMLGSHYYHEIMRKTIVLSEHCSIKFILSIMMDRRVILLMK